MYSCTHCDDKIPYARTLISYENYSPYVKDHEAFCSENCAQLEYAARKANDE